MLSLESRVRLNDGAEMPVLGLGVWKASGAGCVRAVRTALDLGYRLVDTASMYGNEAEVGRAVRESGVPRDEVFVTTKVWNTEQGYDATRKACAASLRRLGLDAVDLYLIHWPVEGARRETWRALQRLQKDGKARSIGVSNYMVPHLEELRKESPVVPAVDQIELHPFLHPADVTEYCRQRGIAVEAYSPLARGRKLEDTTLQGIAARVGRTPAQVMIRWSLQHGFVAIPKSERPERIRENADVFGFTLSEGDMKALDGLHQGYHVTWDPSTAP